MMVGRRPWNADERRSLSEHFSAIDSSRLQHLIEDRSVKAIRDQARRMGLTKCHERLRELGRENVEKRWGPLRKPPSIQT